MVCQEVKKNLFDLHEGVVEETIAAEIRDHLQTCSDCQREWASVQRFANFWDALSAASFASAPWPPEEHPHLKSDELWTLAEYSGGELNQEDRARWEHMLECRSCFSACAWMRGLLQNPERYAVPEIRTPIDNILSAWQAMRLTIICQWVGTALVLHSTVTASRRRARGPTRRPNEAWAEAWTIEQTFGQYTVMVTLSPDAPEKKTCRMDLALAALSPEVSLEGVRAELYRSDKELVGSRSFRNAQTGFPPLPIGDYHLELTKDGKPIGFIELPIREAPAES
jgi:hypothetical protein